MQEASKNPQQARNILVVGGTGKTGRRVVERLKTRDISVCGLSQVLWCIDVLCSKSPPQESRSVSQEN
jgi:hypothetical protein